MNMSHETDVVLSAATAKPEVWLCQIEGRVSLKIVTDLYEGRSRTISVKGVGSVLRITDHQRILCQETITDPKLDPFKNGMLVRRQSEAEKSDQELSDDELLELLELEDDLLEAGLNDLSEVNVRRLDTLAKENGGKFSQVHIIEDHIKREYAIRGGDTPSYRMLRGER